jgi:sulfate permease, SulP family
MLSRYFPILIWSRQYDRETLVNDLIAAVIVTIMLIPQSLAYALLAGLPPEIGLYASIAPLLIYAIFGTSRTLAVGPVAVASLMTAAAVGELASQGTPEYIAAAIALAFLSGLMLTVMGLLRLGFLANFLSHPVISGFITASAVIIAAGQFKNLTGVPAKGHNLLELIESFFGHLDQFNIATTLIGVTAIVFLYWSRKQVKPLLKSLGLSNRLADIGVKTAPILSITLTTLVVFLLGLDKQGVAIVGDIPNVLPVPVIPAFDAQLWRDLAMPALLISIVGYVETISVAQTLAAKRRQRIDPDQELIALGTANMGSAVSGGFPVTGGFSRSVVNFEAGAQTPAAGAFTAVGIALATIFLTPLIFFLPKATLGATIFVAVLSLIDVKAIRHTFAYSKADFAAMAATVVLTLVQGVEIGIISGVAISLFLHLQRTSKPHYAIVGRVPGTEHFRNILRHAVETDPKTLSIRIDESLYFPNARFLEDTINSALAADAALENIVLMCPAVNFIDSSALESIEALNLRLKDSGVRLHLSEVKGPVMDRLKRTHFFAELGGNIYLSQNDAFEDLKSDNAC